MKRFCVLGVSVFLAVLQSPPLLHADYQLTDNIREFGEKRWIKGMPTRLHAGPLKIHPTLTNKFEYDDNVLLSHTKRRPDFVFKVSPGTILELPINKHQIAVGYQADIETLAVNSNQNTQDQHFFALTDFHFPDWYINTLEKFDSTSDRSGTTFTQRIHRIDQQVNPKIGYKWKRATFEGGFNHFYRKFSRTVDKPYNFQERSWTGVFYYDLFARLKALADYTFAVIEYPGNTTRNLHVNQGRIGLEGEVMPDMFVKVRAGPQFRTYRYKERHDFNSWMGLANISYKFRKNWRVEFEANRDAIEATFQDVNFYRQYGIRTKVEYRFRHQWLAYEEFHYYRNNYAERAFTTDRSGYRHDNHFVSRTGIRYLFREWLEFQLAYEWLRRNSNFSGQSYNDNRISLTSNLRY